MTNTSIKNIIFSTPSVRNRLTRDLTLLVLLLISIFLTFSYLYSKQIQQNITQAIITSAKKMVIDKNHRIFDPINNNLLLSRKWAELEALTPDKHNTFNKRFIPVLETLPQISSVILASSKGDEYFFTKQGDNWLSRHINPETIGKNQAQWQLWNGNNKVIKQWEEHSNYQSKNRPWYQLGLSTDIKTPIKWTTPYSFYTQQIPGVTGVTSWQDKSGIRFVLAFDVTLSDIAQSLSTININNKGIAYLISPKGEVILPPGNKHIIKGTSNHGSLYVPGDAHSNYVIFDSVNNWLSNGSKLNQAGHFSRNNKLWWYKVFALETYQNSIYAGVVVPEKELLDIINENTMFILTGIGILIILALAMANFLVNKYAHQLKDVPKTSIVS
ncbi:MAG: cache domain-containing protein, partial [gamma proteobacterium symbiont of Bathyaustriella thionipta]|nr:cache domain-containing protein [gamma proteobacterium symbiont of Bathyaustriella thionipta]